MHPARKFPAVFGGARSSLGLFAASVAALATMGCGNQYRPVVSAINPVGPAGQPTKYAVAVSSPDLSAGCGPSAPTGLATFVDFSGDTVLSTPSILPNPSYFNEGTGGTQGVAINTCGTMNTFGLGNPTSLQTKDIVRTTLPTGLTPLTVEAYSPAGLSTTYFVPSSPGSISVLSSNGPSLLQQISVSGNPVYVVGASQAPRVYAISQSTGGGAGFVTALEAATPLSISATIPVGNNPVYGVMTADARRAFILNQGSGNVSVINVTNNAPDVTTPTIAPPPGTTWTNPIWADIDPLTAQLVVLNAGDGTHAGSLAIVNIPLCTLTSLPSNPNCNVNNPIDAQGFGQVLATVPVGINPQMVQILQDQANPMAYVVNQADSTGTCAAGQGSVSAISLISNTVVATICGSADGDVNAPTIFGHPTTLATSAGTPAGKVYITSPDSRYMSIIYTNTNTVQTHVNLQGYGIKVVMTNP